MNKIYKEEAKSMNDYWLMIKWETFKDVALKISR